MTINYRFLDVFVMILIDFDTAAILAENNLIHADFAVSIARRGQFFSNCNCFFVDNFALPEKYSV